VAAFASAILPGVGQFIGGDSRRGARLLMIDAVIGAVFIIVFLRGGSSPTEILLSAAALWIKPSALALMMVANIILLGYRVWAADDAYRLAKRRHGAVTPARSGLILLGAVILGSVLLVPHAVFGYYDLVTYDTLTSVFGSNTVASSTDTTTNNHDTTLSPRDGRFREHGGYDRSGHDNDRASVERVRRRGTPEHSSHRRRLRSGQDGHPDRHDDHCVDRHCDRRSVWDCACYPELINELWVAGTQYPDAFPGPGTPSENAVKGVIGRFLGVEIDYYAMVNLDGFVEIVDALGGVDIYVPSKVIDENYPHEDGSVERIEIDPGWQQPPRARLCPHETPGLRLLPNEQTTLCHRGDDREGRPCVAPSQLRQLCRRHQTNNAD